MRTSSAAKRLAGGGREDRLDRPVLAGGEAVDLALALDDEAHGDRLDAPGRQAAADLARQERAERVADEPVDDPPRLLGVDEVHVDLARVGERLADGRLGDLVEGHPPRLGRGDVGRLGDVPGDRLALAVEVGGEVDRGRTPLAAFSMSATCLRRSSEIDVLGLEIVVDVDAELALAGVLGQVADMAVGRQDPVIGAEIALDGAGLGRRFDDDEVLWHGRECSTGSSHPRRSAYARGSVRPRGSAAGSPRRSRARSRARRPARPATGRGRRRDGRLDRRIARPGSPPEIAAGGISTNRMWRYGKKKIEAMSSMKTGRLPFIMRRFVQRRPTSPGAGGSNRSASSGCSLVEVEDALRITGRWWPGASARLSARRWSRSGVVEVDHQADPAAGRPRRRSRRGRTCAFIMLT